MFLDELTPLFLEFTQQPLAFTGGFFAGILRLKLTDEPIKSWIDRQVGVATYSVPATESHNGKNGGPQSISID